MTPDEKFIDLYQRAYTSNQIENDVLYQFFVYTRDAVEHYRVTGDFTYLKSEMDRQIKNKSAFYDFLQAKIIPEGTTTEISIYDYIVYALS
jgi:hypothetical protein